MVVGLFSDSALGLTVEQTVSKGERSLKNRDFAFFEFGTSASSPFAQSFVLQRLCSETALSPEDDVF